MEIFSKAFQHVQVNGFFEDFNGLSVCILGVVPGSIIEVFPHPPLQSNLGIMPRGIVKRIPQ